LSRHPDRVAVAVATLVSLSYGYLIAAMHFRSTLLGGDYSHRLFATVELNTALTFGLFLIGVVRRSSSRLLLACTSLTTSMAWFLVWAVNSAVLPATRLSENLLHETDAPLG
jgi:hypothetical protein